MVKKYIAVVTVFLSVFSVFGQDSPTKQKIKALYIPLADHYAGIVAYEKYAKDMKHADYQIAKMKSWGILRAYFMAGEAEAAFLFCPLAMDMFMKEPTFRWVSLMQRDGNALAINDLLNKDAHLELKRSDRKPDKRVAEAFSKAKERRKTGTECGVPHLLSTQTVILYKYLKDNNCKLSLARDKDDSEVVAIEVSSPKSPVFLKKKNSRAIPASFEQSLPWADVVETGEFGHVAWYSKDVMPWKNGHVECIMIATDNAIKNKKRAMQEVIHAIHQAGMDIEKARHAGGKEMDEIVKMIRKHIPEHSAEAIVQSLRPDLNVINYRHLNIDKEGLKQIMDFAVEGKILSKAIDINAFADASFSTKITDMELTKPGKYKVGFAGNMSQQTKNRIESQILALEKYAENPILVKAVKEQNAKNTPLAEIKAIDKDWIAGHRENFAASLQENPPGRFLKDNLVNKETFFSEAFLCDKSGAIVGEYPKTSDYWQGDEEKFISCYNNGNGKFFAGQLKFDKSTLTYSIQVSVPVKDGNKTIGVLVVGLVNEN